MDLFADINMSVFGAGLLGFTLYRASRMANLWQHKRRLWAMTVMAVWSLAAIFVGLQMVFRSRLYDTITTMCLGLALMLVVTIPCGIRFFNRKYVRPVRNLAFLAVGGDLVWTALRHHH